MTKIIVLIPHYNNFEDLILSIKSINESINVDILIVDDGSNSSVPVKSELENFYQHGKIFLDILEENKGIEFALNRGLELIESMDYEYIGRLDSGDFCIKDRFKKQISYLETNKDTYLLGTWVNVINADKELSYVLKHPISYNEIKKKMFTNSMFVHPSVVFRKSILKNVGYYPTNYKAAEDYAFFFRIVNNYKSENLPEALLNYVIDDKSISSTKRKLQVKSRIRVILYNFRFGFYPIYGLVRNVLLYFISRKTSHNIKRIFRA
ncbi:glycosyltransferase [Winogradskyella sediminis]|uniref:glycosyltransferase n=1 Tax=Winogradskyella sediminis TaxID=1382466 RepID=UPI003AA9D771